MQNNNLTRSPDNLQSTKETEEVQQNAGILEQLCDNYLDPHVWENSDHILDTPDSSDELAHGGGGGYISIPDLVRHEWSAKTTRPLPASVRRLLLTCKITRLSAPSVADRIKVALEAYTGEPWLWWPFRPPRPALGQDRVRLEWKDAGCFEHNHLRPGILGCEHWLDISQALVHPVEDLVDGSQPDSRRLGASFFEKSSYTTSAVPSLGSSHYTGAAISPLDPTAGQTHMSMSSTSTSITAQGSRASTSDSPSVYKSPQIQRPTVIPLDRFLLVCTERWGRKRSEQIVIAALDSDDDFFAKFKLTYRQLRGFWQYWLDPRQFVFCHASKFERWAEYCLGKCCNGMPDIILDEYEFDPKPPVIPYLHPPICEDEWIERIYYGKRTNGRREALTRLPLRTKRHQVKIHVNGREYFWGLHAQLRPAAAVVIGWMVFILGGAFIFTPVWLSSHPGDLQNATVPVMVLIAALALLWIPLNSRFKKE